MMIRTQSLLRTRWDIIIMVLSIWNCFGLPLDIGFNPPIFKTILSVYFNFAIDFCFALDIIFNFRTTISDDLTGDEIVDPKIIASHYLKRRFIIDILATVPFDALLLNSVGKEVSGKLSLLSLLKLFRLLRITKIIMYMNTSESIKHSLKIFKLIFYLMIYIHC